MTDENFQWSNTSSFQTWESPYVDKFYQKFFLNGVKWTNDVTPKTSNGHIFEFNYRRLMILSIFVILSSKSNLFLQLHICFENFVIVYVWKWAKPLFTVLVWNIYTRTILEWKNQTTISFIIIVIDFHCQKNSKQEVNEFSFIFNLRVIIVNF